MGQVPYDSCSIAFQLKEIMEHKWYLSERERKDVGMNQAIEDWVVQGLAELFRERFNLNLEAIAQTCQQKCPDSHCEIYQCSLTLEEVHAILKD